MKHDEHTPYRLLNDDIISSIMPDRYPPDKSGKLPYRIEDLDFTANLIDSMHSLGYDMSIRKNHEGKKAIHISNGNQNFLTEIPEEDSKLPIIVSMHIFNAFQAMEKEANK